LEAVLLLGPHLAEVVGRLVAAGAAGVAAVVGFHTADDWQDAAQYYQPDNAEDLVMLIWSLHKHLVGADVDYYSYYYCSIVLLALVPLAKETEP
jgi:hypothetical protein